MSGHTPLSARTEEIASIVIDSALAVHRELGPGMLEPIYEECFCCELQHRNIAFERQKYVALRYRNLTIPNALRLDVLVEREVIVEIKAIELLQPIHSAQLLSYLRLSQHRLGLLINFNVVLLKEGIKRLIL